MTDLSNQACEACQIGAPLLTEQELAECSSQIPEWQVGEDAGVKYLVRTFMFGNFVKAMAFANKVADLAEEHNHHPKIVVEWGKTEVSWWTHKIGGIHKNDAILAAKTDLLFS